MSINPNEFFTIGRYHASLWYPGYDEKWILGRTAPPSSSAGEGGEKKNTKREEKKEKGVIELKMPLCCEECVEKVKTKLIDIEGVTSVHCSSETQKVTVKGEAKPEAVLAKAKKILRRSEFWKDADKQKT